MTREDEAFNGLEFDIKDVRDQFFIDTATWSLSRWEKICNIKTDESKPYSQRRSLIKSRLRGIGTVTVALVKDVSESFVNGECDVVQFSSEYRIEITFVGSRGRPENQADIEKALRDIVPAHLGINYKFTYISWDEIEANGMTFDTMDTYTWDGLERAFLS